MSMMGPVHIAVMMHKRAVHHAPWSPKTTPPQKRCKAGRNEKTNNKQNRDQNEQHGESPLSIHVFYFRYFLNLTTQSYRYPVKKLL